MITKLMTLGNDLGASKQTIDSLKSCLKSNDFKSNHIKLKVTQYSMYKSKLGISYNYNENNNARLTWTWSSVCLVIRQSGTWIPPWSHQWWHCWKWPQSPDVRRASRCLRMDWSGNTARTLSEEGWGRRWRQCLLCLPAPLHRRASSWQRCSQCLRCHGQTELWARYRHHGYGVEGVTRDQWHHRMQCTCTCVPAPVWRSLWSQLMNLAICLPPEVQFWLPRQEIPSGLLLSSVGSKKVTLYYCQGLIFMWLCYKRDNII